MLGRMLDAWAVWLLVVGLAVGVAATFVLLVRLPRAEDDIGPEERSAEADWIAGVIEDGGGVAPVALVEEVLELHQAYLGLRRPPIPPSRTTGSAAGPPPQGLPPGSGYPPPGYAPPPPGPRDRI